jgi:DNA (cytosine-5)-methyltransferase 1
MGHRKAKRNCLSLFSGIGGLDLGFEAEGFTIGGQVEIDPLCTAVLARHWPDTPRHGDVNTFEWWYESQGRPSYDVIFGGFPCQPFSHAGARRGIEDSRWLWPAFHEVITLVRPRYVCIENVPGLRTIDSGDVFKSVLGDLAAGGYDAIWSSLSAASLGFPHRRSRLFILAYAHGILGESRDIQSKVEWASISDIPDVDEAATRALASFAYDGREADGSAGGMAVAGGLTARMVSAGGNAVVPAMGRVCAQLLKLIDNEQAQVRAV